MTLAAAARRVLLAGLAALLQLQQSVCATTVAPVTDHPNFEAYDERSKATVFFTIIIPTAMVMLAVVVLMILIRGSW